MPTCPKTSSPALPSHTSLLLPMGAQGKEEQPSWENPQTWASWRWQKAGKITYKCSRPPPTEGKG